MVGRVLLATGVVITLMAGSAYAGSRWLITNINQIKPSVRAELRGQRGPVGAKGAVGATGPQGLAGAIGPQGLPGQQGPPGRAATQGPTGPNGISGYEVDETEAWTRDTGDVYEASQFCPTGKVAVSGGFNLVGDPNAPQVIASQVQDNGLG